VTGDPDVIWKVWLEESVIPVPPTSTLMEVRFQPDRNSGLFVWLWHPVSDSPHSENVPLNSLPDQTHTSADMHSVFANGVMWLELLLADSITAVAPFANVTSSALATDAAAAETPKAPNRAKSPISFRMIFGILPAFSGGSAPTGRRFLCLLGRALLAEGASRLHSSEDEPAMRFLGVRMNHPF